MKGFVTSERTGPGLGVSIIPSSLAKPVPDHSELGERYRDDIRLDGGIVCHAGMQEGAKAESLHAVGEFLLITALL
jgi:hypothetical protein